MHYFTIPYPNYELSKELLGVSILATQIRQLKILTLKMLFYPLSST